MDDIDRQIVALLRTRTTVVPSSRWEDRPV